MKTPIFDSDGRDYSVGCAECPDGSFHLEVRQGSESVGEALSSIRENGSIVLEDICIRDDSAPRRNGIVLDLLGRSSAPLSFRGRRLGTALLRCFIDRARAKGLRRVYCSITGEDLSRTPHLSEWYKRHGFVECAPYEYHVPGAESYICLELQ